MKYAVTNNTPNPRIVYVEGRGTPVQIGETVEIAMNAKQAEAEKVDGLEFVRLAGDRDPIDHDGDGEKGGFVQPESVKDAAEIERVELDASKKDPEPNTSPKPRGRPRKDAE